jgi:hypothetical protein
MNAQEIAYKYIQACQVQSNFEQKLDQALGLLCADNQLISVSDPIHKAYLELVQDILGEELFDWVQWWQYETDYGREPRDFTVNNQEYTTDGMTLLKFLELVA